MASVIHVATTGSDAADGSASSPFRTINHAAGHALPGDTVVVHEGVYREWVCPPRGGLSDVRRITYQAAPGEHPRAGDSIALAVRDFPQVNARFDDEAGVLTQHAEVHLGIATQTDGGLMVPVLRDAQAHDLWANAAEVVRLAEAARSGKAVRDELSGSTITLTSLGRLGGIMSTPVINHPEVAIVGVNRIALRPMIRNGAVVARPMMNLSSSFDHRVVDGAVAAAFVQALRELLEQPALLFVE